MEQSDQVDQQQPKRPGGRKRWFRYGLRTLIALMLLAAVAAASLAPMIRSRRGEQQAINSLRAANGAQNVNVLYANPFAERDGQGEMEMIFQGGPNWLTEWLGVDLFRTVTSLQSYAPGNRFTYRADASGQLVIEATYNTGLGDDDMQTVNRLPNLEYLYLEAAPVGDEGAAHIANLKRLRELNLGNTQITSAGLQALAKLPNLRKLNVSRTHVSDEAIDVLASFRALEEVNLQITRVSDAGVEKLQAQRPGLLIEK